MSRSKSSQRWLKEHFDDPYVKQAHKEGYRGRAAYKLIEIQEKDRIIKPGMLVVDLGAAPGGWSQVVLRFLKKSGKLFALDILPIERIDEVTFIQGDFQDPTVIQQMMSLIHAQKVDLVLSDIAPNIGGVNAVDQARSMVLAELAFEFSKQVLKQDGDFLVKVFQGEGFDALLTALRQSFKKVVVRKPKASRDRSRELYLLCRGYKGP